MFDDDQEKSVKHNLLLSLPKWMRSVENMKIFKDLSNSFVKYLEEFSEESRVELVHFYENFKHFCENSKNIQKEKEIYEKNSKELEKENRHKLLYANHLNDIINQNKPTKHK